jgi:NitT/TauT family transport system substrate-binding protein
LAEILASPGVSKVFDSRQIPGEIIDLMVARTEVLEDNPDFGKALAGIWYETMGIMTADTPEGAAARAAMGAASGTDQAGYEAQLAATRLFSDPAEAVAFTTSPDLSTTMDLVRTFLFDKGLLGAGAPSVDVVGIEFADGSVLGDSGNIRFRFTDTYMKAAADGTL